MRTTIEIDDALMAEAQQASGRATRKETIEQALRLLIRLRRQREAGFIGDPNAPLDALA